MDDNDNYSYISSVDAFAPEKDAPSIDVPDEKALDSVMQVLAKEYELYHTLSGVNRFDKSLPLQMRFELCDHYLQLLLSLSQSINNAIDGIKEKAK